MRSIAARIASHALAWRQLPTLSRLTLDNCSLEDITSGVFDYAEGFFGLDQIREEILVALREVQALRPRCVVEIGRAGGGTLLLWSRVAHPEALLISIDLPGARSAVRASWLRAPLFRRMVLPGQTVRLINADSHRPSTLEKTLYFLRANPVDFLFIDGDHSDAGVREDFAMYGPLVRSGGIVGFHDIALKTAEHQVYRLWGELEEAAKTRAILGGPAAYGIGLVYR